MAILPADKHWPPKDQGDSAAANALKLYYRAEATYAKTYPDIGYSADFASLGSGTDPLADSTPQHAGLVVSQQACPGNVCEYDGYRFTYTRVSKDHYFITARVIKWGQGSIIGYYIDETGVLHSTIEDREATVNDEPVTGADGTPIK